MFLWCCVQSVSTINTLKQQPMVSSLMNKHRTDLFAFIDNN